MFTVIGHFQQLFRATSKYHPSDRDTVYCRTKYKWWDNKTAGNSLQNMLQLGIAKLFQLFKYPIEFLIQFIVNLTQHNSQKCILRRNSVNKRSWLPQHDCICPIACAITTMYLFYDLIRVIYLV
jgi:hypothetical protein